MGFLRTTSLVVSVPTFLWRHSPAVILPTDSSRQPDSDGDYLPARMLNEFTYCPRLFFLEHVEGLFADNADTIEGSLQHRRVDARTDTLAHGKQMSEDDAVHARSVTLASDHHGVLAKLDLVETQGDQATPVDYKRGRPRVLEDGTLGAWNPERVQLCVQALVLRANGYRCDEGLLFFWETRQRVRIPIDDGLVALTEQMIADARQTAEAGILPPPLVDSPKCPRCSLVGICLPDETNACRTADGRSAQPLLFDIGPVLDARPAPEPTDPAAPTRRLIAARDDRRPLYLNTQGMMVGKAGEVLQMRDEGRLVQEVRIRDVNQVNLMGSIQCSTQAIQTLLAADVPLVYYSQSGWFYGITQAVGLKNIMWRREQFRAADRPSFCLALTRQLVAAKIRNCRTLLMRNHIEPPPDAIRLLKALQWEANRCGSLGSMLGIEGTAARVYFEHFAGMLKAPDHVSPEAAEQDPDRPLRKFDLRGRNRRPPRDPVNALLSLAYSLLAKDLTVACTAVGLDPFLGFYHQPRFGRPALALDLMEPFRPLIADSAVLSAINTRMVTIDDFQQAGDAVSLTVGGRKAFFRAYEQRMDQMVTHPHFGYRVSYRRVLEIQVRLLARYLMGEITTYPPFLTR